MTIKDDIAQRIVEVSNTDLAFADALAGSILDLPAIRDLVEAADESVAAMKYCQRSFAAIKQQIAGKGLSLSSPDVIADLDMSIDVLLAALKPFPKKNALAPFIIVENKE